MLLTHTHLVKLIVSIVLVQAVGLFGALFTATSTETWYPSLTMATNGPQNWVFSPMWTMLYTLVGVSLFLVWTRHRGGHRRTLWLRIFFIQLILNAMWGVLFFGKTMLFEVLIAVALLWFSILLLVAIALRFDTRASVLLLPYLGWVSFAAYWQLSAWQRSAAE